MTLSGDMLIGSIPFRGCEGSLRAFNPSTALEISEPSFGMGGIAEVERAASLASQAFDTYSHTSLARRAAFLESIADNIMQLGDMLIERAHAETGLPMARLQGERERTMGQLRLFAKVVRDGHYLRATIDSAQPQRQPIPRPDLRMLKVPLGPVAVFGASNFPLAFSVAGGDTASALAAGAPVVVKAHNAHLGTSELIGRAIQKAVQTHDLPGGIFSLLFGAGNTIGEALVAHPAIKAVGFTGSRRGGLALVKIANARTEPIPVYAEMSSVNPVFLMTSALEQRANAIGKAFADSLTMGAGQFCTNPGLVIAIDSPKLESFMESATAAIRAKPAQTMLTPGINSAYCAAVEYAASMEGVQQVAQGMETNAQTNAAQALLYAADAKCFLASPELQSEIFGPASIVIRCADIDEVVEVAESLEGQLTATLQLDDTDHDDAIRLLPVLERKAGRILVNAFPTGVEVSQAMVHGGPFPSTSNTMYTSVGATAIDRFLRPVCYQDLPDALLPEALKEKNPLRLRRMTDAAYA